MKRVMIIGLALTLCGCDGKIGDAKKLVAHDLKDPSSAQFRDVKASSQAVCGEVNAKNSYGAYTGFRHFIVEGGKTELEPEKPAQRLGPGISMDGIDQWNAYTAFRTNWLSKCPEPLPMMDAADLPQLPAQNP
uniref:hypothetical protein n=1 Tax=uncultured Caulobacter sp. TaxID=158749 RepID=UPI0025E3C70D|nr:hypothetical protein [uncultured Caulobacter sp.]